MSQIIQQKANRKLATIIGICSCLLFHTPIHSIEKNIWDEFSIMQAQLKSLKKELSAANKKIDNQQKEITALKKQVIYIRKWTFLGDPEFEKE